ncbi:MAG TPA: hypothetical protein VFS20_33980 [Longimicrobium sp.]|nr:hypothetical protein [Longimicrobium sp.]
MAERAHSRGTCGYCGRELTRGGMTRHLRGCDARAEVVDAAYGRSGRIIPLLHLQARDAWTGKYWLNLEVDGSATLLQLDKYLRRIWLECCGHLSRFSQGGWDGEEIPKELKVGRVFHEGLELTHIYDYGRETITLLKAVDAREGTRTNGHPIALMARNAPPVLPCERCGRQAAQVCPRCVDGGHPGTLCDRHAPRHRHEGYLVKPLELLNSPRAGKCGYVGPADPPY